MARGRQIKALSSEQVALLNKIKNTPTDGNPAGYSVPGLRLAMGAPFSYKIIGKALQGRPVWTNYHFFISEWLERYDRAAQELATEGKRA